MAAEAVLLGIVFEPLQALRLHGSGDRVAREQAPGAIPGEEPLLPRLETLIGALASLAYRTGLVSDDASGRGDWCEYSLGAAAKLLGCTSPGSWITGPFLVARGISTSNKRVFINVSTGLLDADAVDEWVEIAAELREAAAKTLPRERHWARMEAAERIQRLIEEGKLVPWYAVTQRFTSVALEPRTKSAMYNLVYTYTRIHVHIVPAETGLYPAGIALIAQCNASGEKHVPTSIVSLGPRSTPALLLATRLGPETIPEDNEPPYIAVSNAPLWSSIDYAIHPLPPGPGLEAHARAYHTEYGKGFRKDRARASLWPGTVITQKKQDNKDTQPCENTPALRHAPSTKLIKKITTTLKNTLP